jgi:catechol 2,3-dioxygenase-like lactoylglutathione lyase family enzyme
MPKVSGLGHVGIWTNDLPRMAEFYRDVLGLQVSDTRDQPVDMVFLSAKPQEEHHETVLMGPPPTAERLQQVSFYVDSLAELRAFYHEFQARQVRIDMIVSHGNAVGIYFFDPEGNRCEVYWRTGKVVHPPYFKPIDLTRSDEEIMAAL